MPRERKYVELGAYIRRMRQRAGLTQAELARRVGVSPGYLPGVEWGRYQVPTARLRRVADALADAGCDFNELCRLAGYVAPPADDDWRPPPDKAPALRRLSRFSAATLELIDRILTGIAEHRDPLLDELLAGPRLGGRRPTLPASQSGGEGAAAHDPATPIEGLSSPKRSRKRRTDGPAEATQ